MSEFKFSEHFTPVANGVVVEPLRKFKAGDTTESGLVIGAALPSTTPEADAEKNLEGDSLGLRVVAVGKDCGRVKEGDLIMLLPSASYVNMSLFGREFYFTMDYNIMAIISEEADELNKTLTAERKEKERLARVEAFRKEKLVLASLDKSVNN